MNVRFTAGIGLCLYAAMALAGERPGLHADANSAADMKAEQRQLLNQQQRFKTIDTDADGFISEAEAREHHGLLESWRKADLNSDGKIDQTEFSAFETEGAPGAKQ